MATTTPIKFTERPLRIDHPAEVVAELQEMYERALGDEDKADTVENNVFYEGCVWGLKYALGLLTVDPDEEED